MPQTLYIPACHKYIKNKDGSPDSQRIFGVAKSAFLTQYPDGALDDGTLFSFLKCNGLLHPSANLEDIDTERTELCFSVISQYKCNSVCQLCPYSPLYKNQNETSESLILSSCLQNFERLLHLVRNGVSCRDFRAMIPVSEKSAVPVIPLNRLAFEYLENVPKSADDLHQVVPKIIDSLRQNNKGKLSAADLKIATAYLTNLTDRKFGDINQARFGQLVRECFGIACTMSKSLQKSAAGTPPLMEKRTAANLAGAGSAPANTDSRPAAAPGNHTHPDKTPQAAYLEGFLIGKPSQNQAARNPAIPDQATPPPHAAEPKKRTAPAKKQPERSAPSLPNEADGKNKKTENPATDVKEELTASYAQHPNDKSDTPISPNDCHRKPTFWKFDTSRNDTYFIYNMDKDSSRLTERFQQDLLLTPHLPMEIVHVHGETDKTWHILLYAHHSYYCFSLGNAAVLDLILPFLQKSNYRRILCYEPYLLYCVFREHGIYPRLFSLRSAMDYLPGDASYWGASFETLCRMYCGLPRASDSPVRDILYALRNYPKMCREAMEQVALLPPGQQEEYHLRLALDKITGYSFLISRYCACRYLFLSESREKGYHFQYQDQAMVDPYLAIQYEFALQDETEKFSTETMLGALLESRLFRLYDTALLSYCENIVTLAIAERDYHDVCDAIHRVSMRLAETKHYPPVHIYEKRLQ